MYCGAALFAILIHTITMEINYMSLHAKTNKWTLTELFALDATWVSYFTEVGEGHFAIGLTHSQQLMGGISLGSRAPRHTLNVLDVIIGGQQRCNRVRTQT